MRHALAQLVDTAGFVPPQLRGNWSPQLVWLHNSSDALIWLACFVLAVVLTCPAYRSRYVAFRGMYWMFAVCCILIGITHVLEIVIIHVPVYRFTGAVKLVTALFCWASVAASVSAVRQAKAVRHPGARDRQCDRSMEAEAWYQASVEPIRLLVDGVNTYGICALDLHGRVTSWNTGARRISGYEAREIVGRPCDVFYPQEDVASCKPERALRAASTLGRYEAVGWRLRQDGTQFRANVVILPLRDRDGCVRGFIEVVGDLTEQKAREPEVRARKAAFHGLLECTPAAVVIADRAGQIVLVNSRAATTFGYTRQELLGLDFAALFPEHYRTAAPVSRSIACGTRVRPRRDSSGLCGLRKDGTEFPVEIDLNPIKNEDGYTYITAIRDVTKRKRAEAGLAARPRQLGNLIKLVQRATTACEPKVLAREVAALVARILDLELCGVFENLPEGEGLRLQVGVGWRDGLAGQAIESMGAGSLAGFVLGSEDTVVSADFDSESRFAAASLAREHGAVGGMGCVIKGADRPYGVLAAYTTRPRSFTDDEAFCLESLAALLASNLDRIAAEEFLKTQARTDALTGLHNVRHLRETLPAIFAQADRTGSPVSVVMLDVDHFKIFNDTFGHPAGDEVLCQIGAVLRRESRPYDLVARYGGEEFALLLPDTNAAAALAFAERVRKAIASHPWLLRPVTASLGLATTRAGGPEGTVLLRQADAALYAAKHAGRDRVVHHEATERPAVHLAARSGTSRLHLHDADGAWRNRKHPAEKAGSGIPGNGFVAGGSRRVEGPEYPLLVSHLPARDGLEVSGPLRINPVAGAPPSGPAGVSEPMAIVGALLRADRAERELQLARAGIEERLREQATELEQVCDATIEGWARALELRDYETEGHSRRVAELTLRVARRMGFDEPSLVHVRRGALLHDIGKVGVPDAILNKPGPLDEAEWSVMQRHPELAYQMLAPIGFLQEALAIPYNHHERWDGAGYPRGLRGEQIPRAARIFAVVDIYDALSHARPYRAAWPPERVKEHLRSLSGTHLEPEVIEEFLAVI